MEVVPDRGTIHTPRLILRPASSGSFEQTWAAIEASLPELRKWLAWAVEPDPAETRQHLADAEREWAAGLDRHFSIMWGQRVAGTVSVQRVRPLFESAELGYWMRSDLVGRGLMTEAASAAVSFAFDVMGLHRLELHAAPGNSASVRVAEKLGFRKEGTLRHGAKAAQGFHDVDVFGLLSNDSRPTFHRSP